MKSVVPSPTNMHRDAPLQRLLIHQVVASLAVSGVLSALMTRLPCYAASTPLALFRQYRTALPLLPACFDPSIRALTLLP